MPEIYRHTQLGIAVLVPVELVALVALYFFISTHEVSALILFVAFAVVSCLFFALTVIGTDTTLEVRFGAGLIRKRFKIKDIISVQPYRTTFWHGWGIHRSGDGLIMNVSGYDAVQLTMIDGNKYIIGTDDRTRLLNFLQEYRRP